MCNMFDVIKFNKKFFEKKNSGSKVQKTDEKVTSLNVEVHAKPFAYQIFFFYILLVLCARLAHQNLSRKNLSNNNLTQTYKNIFQIKYTARKLSHQ